MLSSGLSLYAWIIVDGIVFVVAAVVAGCHPWWPALAVSIVVVIYQLYSYIYIGKLILAICVSLHWFVIVITILVVVLNATHLSGCLVTCSLMLCLCL